MATSLIIPDISSLDHADPEERAKIETLRVNRECVVNELTRRGEVSVEYNLKVPSIPQKESVELS